MCVPVCVYICLCVHEHFGARSAGHAAPGTQVRMHAHQRVKIYPCTGIQGSIISMPGRTVDLEGFCVSVELDEPLPANRRKTNYLRAPCPYENH